MKMHFQQFSQGVLLCLFLDLVLQAEAEQFLVCATSLADGTGSELKFKKPKTKCKSQSAQTLGDDLKTLKTSLENLKETLQHMDGQYLNDVSGSFEKMSPILTTDSAAKTDHALLGRITWLVSWMDGAVNLVDRLRNSTDIQKGFIKTAVDKTNFPKLTRQLVDVKKMLAIVRDDVCLVGKIGKKGGTKGDKKSGTLINPLMNYKVKVDSVTEDSLYRILWGSAQATNWIREKLNTCKAEKEKLHGCNYNFLEKDIKAL